jgi:biopolymer transport protein ExbD
MFSSRQSSLQNLICRIDVTAFAAVMFALVAMFLAPAAVVDHRDRISVDLAHVSSPAPMQSELREDVMEVAVTRDGKVYFGLDQIMIDSLSDRIRQSASQGGERKVYIRADMRARYGAVKQVLDAVQSAGIENIAFLVDQRHPRGTLDLNPIYRFHTPPGVPLPLKR